MCDCIKLANAELQEKNTKIEDIWALIPGRISPAIGIRTVKLRSRLRLGPAVLLATFCPFCGVKFDG